MKIFKEKANQLFNAFFYIIFTEIFLIVRAKKLPEKVFKNK